MANNYKWDFECPQFVDFVAGLENSGTDDIFFDCKENQFPEDDCVIARSPQCFDGEKYLSEEEENQLLNKMTAALSIIENTPKMKKSAVKGTALTGKFSKDLGCQPSKSTKKPIVRPLGRLHRSKSVAHLNKIIEKANNIKGALRKRSSSLSDLRTCRKQKYPVTPICLKRTIVKAKSKVTKTSEEMELEKIAQLQKKLIRHLRFNEKTMKKMNLKSRQCVIPKPEVKLENPKENKGVNAHLEKVNVAEKVTRQNIEALNPVAIKHVAMKIDNIINSKLASSATSINGINPGNSLISSFSSEVNDKSRIQAKKKSVNNKKLGFHSGLKFHASIKKSTSVKPFSFDQKMKSGKAQNAGDEQLEMPAAHLKIIDGKENIPFAKSLASMKKTIQNSKCYGNESLQSNKTNNKRIMNPSKGLPLSENLTRH